MILSRRKLFALAAPAIITPGVLMKLSVIKKPKIWFLEDGAIFAEKELITSLPFEEREAIIDSFNKLRNNPNAFNGQTLSQVVKAFYIDKSKQIPFEISIKGGNNAAFS